MSNYNRKKAEEKLNSFAKTMFKEFSNEELANSKSREDRIRNIVVSYSCIASVVAFLPPYLIPGADFWSISFIQVMMGLKIAEEFGIEAKRESIGHILKTFGLGFGMGWVAQNAVLTIYRFGLPHFGAITSFSMVFSASFVIGMAFKHYFQNQEKGIKHPREGINSVVKDSFKEGRELAKSIKRKINFDDAKKKLMGLFENNDQNNKAG